MQMKIAEQGVLAGNKMRQGVQGKVSHLHCCSGTLMASYLKKKFCKRGAQTRAAPKNSESNIGSRLLASTLLANFHKGSTKDAHNHSDRKVLRRRESVKIGVRDAEAAHYAQILKRICESRPVGGLPDVLPTELWMHIFSFFSYRESKIAGQVCSLFRDISKEKYVR